jgi:hypothetical protein
MRIEALNDKELKAAFVPHYLVNNIPVLSTAPDAPDRWIDDSNTQNHQYIDIYLELHTLTDTHTLHTYNSILILHLYNEPNGN